MKKKLYVLFIDVMIVFALISFFISLIMIDQYLILFVASIIFAGIVDIYVSKRMQYLYGRCR